MFVKMRDTFGPVAISVIIGAIAMVFVFFGIYSPSNARVGGNNAATVNGEGISMQEFSREYQQRTAMFQNMTKGKLDPDVLKQLHVAEQVVNDLIRRQLVLQEAHRLGMTAPDAEVREKIQEMPYFKDKAGNFDVSRYNAILEANHYTPSSFEDMVREDILRSRMTDFVRNRAKVSEAEIKDDFLAQEDRRQVDYVALTPEIAKKLVIVGNKDVEDALKNKADLDEARAHYERTKMAYLKPAPKGKKDAKPQYYSFDEVKKKVMLDLLRGRRAEEGFKASRALAKDFFEKSKTMSPSAFKAYVKSKGFEVQTSPKFNRLQAFVQGIGEMQDLVDDAFKAESPLAKGPRLYEGARNFVVAMNLRSFKPDLSGFDKHREQLAQNVLNRKSELMFQTWLNDLHQHAKISINKAVTAQDEATD